jgi:hypothetical protein
MVPPAELKRLLLGEYPPAMPDPPCSAGCHTFTSLDTPPVQRLRDSHTEYSLSISNFQKYSFIFIVCGCGATDRLSIHCHGSLIEIIQLLACTFRSPKPSWDRLVRPLDEPEKSHRSA